MPKWVKQIIFSVIMLIVMIAALYTSGKEAGSMDLFYNFLILITAMAYIVSIICVSFDVELRYDEDKTQYYVLLVSTLCAFLPIIGHILWLIYRPKEMHSFEEYMEDEEEPEFDEEFNETA
jgi:uncharacterized membrane protein YbhN (UPF0104 family)